MPTQIITLEVRYDLLDDNGVIKPEPRYWPWEQMCDSYEGEDGRPFYTRGVKVFSPGPLESLPSDERERISWHEENCGPEQCASQDDVGHCPMAQEDED